MISKLLSYDCNVSVNKDFIHRSRKRYKSLNIFSLVELKIRLSNYFDISKTWQFIIQRPDKKQTKNIHLANSSDKKLFPPCKREEGVPTVPVWQLFPVYPGMQLHVYILIASLHVAPYRHGLLTHSSISFETPDMYNVWETKCSLWNRFKFARYYIIKMLWEGTEDWYRINYKFNRAISTEFRKLLICL